MYEMRLILALVFWVSLAAMVYSYALYPVMIFVLARAFGRGATAPLLTESETPSISLLIAAYNEQAVIEGRILNALAMDYPSDRLEIVIASDGSTDQTVAIVRRFAGQNVRLLDYRARRGKASVLNAAAAQLRNPIVLLSDANTQTAPDAARRLVRWFADPAVGAVCGKLVITDPSSGGNVDGLYWKYETFLKKQEGRLGALLGSNGAIYAIRRELFPVLPAGTIVDDFVIPLLAKQRTGCAIVYDGSAVANEESAPDVAAEFQRRARIGAGGWQAIGMLWRLLNPARGWIALTFFSHKILRWLCPFFMIMLLATNFLLVNVTVYRAAVGLQLAFYAAAAVGPRVGRAAPFGKFLRLAHMFVMMNAALLVGFFRWLSGPQTGAWVRTRRIGEAADPASQAPSTPEAVVQNTAENQATLSP